MARKRKKKGSLGGGTRNETGAEVQVYRSQVYTEGCEDSSDNYYIKYPRFANLEEPRHSYICKSQLY